MSEDSPRWPGTQGGPGLDFSPYRKSKDEDADGPKVTDDAAGSTPASPVSPSKADEAKSGPASESSASDTRVTPSAAARAADTARAWASTPVGATPVVPERAAPEGPVSHSTPPRGLKTEIVELKKDGDAAEPAKRRTTRRTRKARLRLSRIDPWSVMKTTFLFAIAIGVMMCAIVFVLWSVLQGSGALDSANTLINQVIGDANNEFDITTYLDIRRVMGFTMMVAFVDVLILTAVATLFAFLYNLSAVVLGGLEVTLAED